MNKPEEVIINGRTFIKITPSENHELVKVGTNEHYSEAIDLPNSTFQYYEVELPQHEPIEESRESNEEESIET